MEGETFVHFVQKDRRRAERVDLQAKVTYVHRTKGVNGEAVSRDISGTGIRLHTEQPLTPGDEIDVTIKSEELGDKPFCAICKVVWSKVAEKGMFEAGIKFLKIENKDEFIQMVCDKLIRSTLESK